MDIKKIVAISQIVVAVLLVLSILIQSRGSGLSGTFGGEGNVYSVRRGAEKILFIFTIVFAIVFVGLAVASLFLAQ